MSTLKPDGKEARAGVWHHSIKETNGEPKPVDEWVCSPLRVVAVSAVGKSDFGRLLNIRNSYGDWFEWCMPMSLLSGSGEELRKELLNMGWEYNVNRAKSIMTYLFSQHPARRVMAAKQTGWHSSGVFVMPDAVLGEADVFFQSETAGMANYSNGGTLEGWQASIAQKCPGNPVLMFVTAASFAGPLLKIVHQGSGGFHLLGDSSKGKSTALNVACSVWGKAEEYMRTWNATGNGLEGVAAIRNDTLLVLDEIKQANPKEIGLTVYSLGNGTGKQRSSRSGVARTAHKWRTLFLSSGEKALETLMMEAGERPNAGQLVRLPSVPAVFGPHGAFHELHGMRDGAELAAHLNTASNTHYGHAGKAFIRALVIDDAEAVNAAFRKMKGLFGARNSQEGRCAERFALVALAGELAIGYGVLPWPEGTAVAAVQTLYKVWQAEQKAGHNEDTQILDAVATFLDRCGGSHFEPLKGSEHHTVRDRAGFYDDRPSGLGDSARVYLFTEGGLKAAVKGYDFTRTLKALDEAGWLVEKESGKRSKNTRTREGQKRLYYVQPQEAV
ncbi:MAG: DUF927 domain-containing protein [Hahellaceae bacterium]|nr:DUF927 domain-containing protein [Hahellaceae bacterium]